TRCWQVLRSELILRNLKILMEMGTQKVIRNDKTVHQSIFSPLHILRIAPSFYEELGEQYIPVDGIQAADGGRIWRHHHGWQYFWYFQITLKINSSHSD